MKDDCNKPRKCEQWLSYFDDAHQKFFLREKTRSFLVIPPSLSLFVKVVSTLNLLVHYSSSCYRSSFFDFLFFFFSMLKFIGICIPIRPNTRKFIILSRTK